MTNFAIIVVLSILLLQISEYEASRANIVWQCIVDVAVVCLFISLYIYIVIFIHVVKKLYVFVCECC